MTRENVSTGTSSSDRTYLLLLVIASLAAAGWLVVNAIADVVVVMQNTAIPFSVSIPTTDVATPIPPEGDGATASSVGTSTLDLVIGNLGGGMPFWLILSALMPALSYAAALVSVAVLSLRVWQGNPFEKSALRMLDVAATSILVAAVVGGTVQLWTSRGVITTVFGAENYVEPSTGIDLTLVGVGVGLTVISLAFRIGQRLQRDTDGLV